MSILKIGCAGLLAAFLISCGPIMGGPVATLTPSAQPTLTAPVQAKPWPGLHDGWTTYKGGGSLGQPVYDGQGSLWATNNTSVFRWNIASGDFTEFTELDGLPKTISGIREFDGTIWIASDADKGTLANYSNGKWTSQSIGFGHFYTFSRTRERLWVNGDKGLYYFEGEAWKKFDALPEDMGQRYFNVTESKDGSLWLWGGGVIFRFKGGAWKTYGNLQSIQNVVTLSDGTMLFISYDLIVSFDGVNLKPVVLPGDYFYYSIKRSLLTPDGDLWFQTYDATYLIHDGKVRKIPDVDFRDPPDKSLYAPIALIPGGWLFTNYKSLYLYDEKSWKEFATKDSPFSQLLNTSDIDFSPNGSLWALQSGAPVRFDGKEVESVFKDDHCGVYSSAFVIDSGGSLWAWSYGSNNLCVFDVKAQKAFLFKLFFDIDQLVASPDGTVWAASDVGFIAALKPDILKSGDYRRIQMIKVGGDLVHYTLIPSRILAGADGAVWVFVKNAGLYRYHGGEWKYFGLSTLKDASALAVDSKGRVWAGLCGALFMNDGEKWNEYPRNCINPSEMIVAPDDAVWFVNSCDGVYRFDGKDWTHFTAEQLGGFVPGKILVAPDGALWFINYQTWVRYKPQ